MAASLNRARYSTLRQLQKEEAAEGRNSAWKDLLLALDDAKWIGSFVALVLAVCMFNLLTQDAPQTILHTEDLALVSSLAASHL